MLLPAAWIGDFLRKRLRPLQDGERGDYGVVLGQPFCSTPLATGKRLEKINSDIAELQKELWSAVQSRTAQPTPLVAPAISGMNDVLNLQGYTQAAWWNRIPVAAWGLMVIIAFCCNLLIGYGARRREARTFLILPFAVSIAFCRIADIDSPHAGAIRVVAQNLDSVVHFATVAIGLRGS